MLKPFSHRTFSKWVYTPLLIALGLFILLLRFGSGPTGSDARVNLGPFQPVELIKILIVFFLVCVLVALLLTPQRRILKSKWFGVAVLLMILLALPNLLWQIHFHFPTLEWLRDVQNSDKDVKLGPLA